MRNRAKCKLCGDIIESYHRHDYVTCKCGEISIDGGQAYFKCVATDLHNIIRLDDEGNEIIPKVIDKEDVKPLDIKSKPGRQDKIKMLKDMLEVYNNLPQAAMTSFTTNYEIYSLMLLVSSILEED